MQHVVLFVICIDVIYWPSTESSIKRGSCVKKWKKSGSRWTLENNIMRCPDGLSQSEDASLRTSLQTEDLAALSDPRLSNPSQEVLLWSREELGSILQSVLVTTHLSHTTNINPFENKVWEIYFYKKCVRSFIEVRKLCLIMVPLVFVWRLYNIRYNSIYKRIDRYCYMDALHGC